MWTLLVGMAGLAISSEPIRYEQSFLRGRTKVDVLAEYRKAPGEDPTRIEGTMTLTDSNIITGAWKPSVTRKIKLAYLQEGTQPDVWHGAGTIIETPFADERLLEIHVTENCPGKTIEFFTPAHRIERMGFLHACGKVAKAEKLVRK